MSMLVMKMKRLLSSLSLPRNTQDDDDDDDRMDCHEIEPYIVFFFFAFVIVAVHFLTQPMAASYWRPRSLANPFKFICTIVVHRRSNAAMDSVNEVND